LSEDSEGENKNDNILRKTFAAAAFIAFPNSLSFFVECCPMIENLSDQSPGTSI
jgi:hypothetical protein